MDASNSKLNISKTKKDFEPNFQGALVYKCTAISANFSSLALS
jgi:hypothetical protein